MSGLLNSNSLAVASSSRYTYARIRAYRSTLHKHNCLNAQQEMGRERGREREYCVRLEVNERGACIRSTTIHHKTPKLCEIPLHIDPNLKCSAHRILKTKRKINVNTVRAERWMAGADGSEWASERAREIESDGSPFEFYICKCCYSFVANVGFMFFESPGHIQMGRPHSLFVVFGICEPIANSENGWCARAYKIRVLEVENLMVMCVRAV